jgi:hypothetical protein
MSRQIDRFGFREESHTARRGVRRVGEESDSVAGESNGNQQR